MKALIDFDIRWVPMLLGVLLMTQAAGCATAKQESDGREVYHAFALKVSDSLKEVKNLRYSYGRLGRGVLKPVAAGPLTIFSSTMPIPEYFEASWETLDGVSHAAKVPVRGHLPKSIKGRTVLFVIMQDTVEGYIRSHTDFGPDDTRFY